MIRKPNFTRRDRNPTEPVASELGGYSNLLDRDRAESMADEGGAAGAHVDAAGLEVTAVIERRPLARRLRRVPGRPWLVGAAVLGLAIAAGWWLRRRA